MPQAAGDPLVASIDQIEITTCGKISVALCQHICTDRLRKICIIKYHLAQLGILHVIKQDGSVGCISADRLIPHYRTVTYYRLPNDIGADITVFANGGVKRPSAPTNRQPFCRFRQVQFGKIRPRNIIKWQHKISVDWPLF